MSLWTIVQLVLAAAFLAAIRRITKLKYVSYYRRTLVTSLPPLRFLLSLNYSRFKSETVSRNPNIHKLVDNYLSAGEKAIDEIIKIVEGSPYFGK